jgi:hypothetical protein
MVNGKKKEVIIIGAGMAGMSAALRLLERDFKVTLYEQDQYIGGMLRSYWDPDRESQREHSYHMFMNWYYNTWKIVDEIGAKDNFSPREAFKFLYKGHMKDMPELVNPGGPQDMIRNLRSGAAPAPDLFLFMYSMIDLLSQPLHRDRFLDKFSVNGFLASRPYGTEGVAELHQKVWETVWAISSFNASAMSYKNFLKYGNRVPVPQLWLLKGSKQEMLIDPFKAKLESFNDGHYEDDLPFRLELGHELLQVVPTADGKRIEELQLIKVKNNPSLRAESVVEKGTGLLQVSVGDRDVIMATTPGAMAEFVAGSPKTVYLQDGEKYIEDKTYTFPGDRGALYNADQRLGEVQYLESEPMAAVELHFNRKLPDIPNDVTVFMDTDFQMTFLDYSQVWEIIDGKKSTQTNTFLYLTISDFKALLSVPGEKRDDDGNLILNFKKPTTAVEYILAEASKNLEFDESDIDLRKTAIQTNNGADLFANIVGSWDYRPETTTNVENLYMAGTYVRNFADVSTIEGAVASGLNAAEAIRSKHKQGNKIEVIYPDYYPDGLFQALKIAWAPYAAMAKAAVMAKEFAEGKGAQGWWGQEGKFPSFPGSGMSNPSHYRDSPKGPEDLGSLFWDFLPRSLWGKDGGGMGPLFWNYGPDGRKR